MNNLLNYGYGILYCQVWGAVLNAGLEPFAGFLHVDRPEKPSLVLDLVEEFRQPGADDIFDLCDTLDVMSWKHYEREEASQANEQDRWHAEGEVLEIHRMTCSWLVEQGIEDIAGGRALLLAKAVELADRFGDPQGLLPPVKRIQKSAPKIGWNDPCPCGSGLKYIRCCLSKAAKAG